MTEKEINDYINLEFKNWKGRLSAQGGPASGGVVEFMYYVYIVYSQKLGKKYIGSTDDIKRRIKQHNSGHNIFTSRGIPWKLIYYEAFLSKDDAINEERFLKTGKGRERLKYLLENTNGRVA